MQASSAAMKATPILFSLLTLAITSATAHATRGELARPVTHCPGCDTSAPDYGSSAWDRRYDAGKYQQGSGQYPYSNRPSNADRWNQAVEHENQVREQQRREAAERQRQEQLRDLYGDTKPRW